MKVRTLLVAAVMFVALSAAAFAQATFSVGSIPVTTVTASGNAEKSGDVTFSMIQGSSPSVSGTITITYGVAITVPANAIVITGFGGFAGVNAPTLVTPFDGTAGKVVLAVPTGVAFGAAGASFTVSGVRVQIAGSSLSSLAASISSTGNAIVAGQTGVTVINSIAAGLAKVGVNPVDGKAIKATQVSALDPEAATCKMTASENYLDAFGKVYGPLPDDPTITANPGGIMIRFTLSAAPPAKVSLVFPAITGSTGANSIAAWQLVDKDGVPTAKTIKSDTTDLTVYYKLVSSSTPVAIDDITVSPIDVVIGSDPVLPLPAVSITYVASLAPIKAAFNTDGKTVTGLPIPRFEAADVGTGKLLDIAGSTTTLLVPYATTFNAGGYNTGFAIANTTVDPGENAIPQTGTLTFTMYNQQNGATEPKSYSYTTSATSPGTGLDATGLLPAGSTYTVLLSELLSAAGAPADFTGYVIIEANFTNAHAQYVTSDFSGFTQGSLALVVVDDDRKVSPEALNN